MATLCSKTVILNFQLSNAEFNALQAFGIRERGTRNGDELTLRSYEAESLRADIISTLKDRGVYTFTLAPEKAMHLDLEQHILYGIALAMERANRQYLPPRRAAAIPRNRNR